MSLRFALPERKGDAWAGMRFSVSSLRVHSLLVASNRSPPERFRIVNSPPPLEPWASAIEGVATAANVSFVAAEQEHHLPHSEACCLAYRLSACSLKSRKSRKAILTA